MSLPHKKPLLSLAFIMSARMFGLFMILPIFVIQAQQFPGATATLIGIALGIYGLMQACLQMPFGMLSDRLGRSPVIAIGLLLFIIGSVVAALSHSIGGLIVGRALQGSGAIGSTVLATAADLSQDEKRSQVMALMGMIIGLSFFVAFAIGPLLNQWIHLSGIFWVNAGMGAVALLVLFTALPSSQHNTISSEIDCRHKRLGAILKQSQLWRLNTGIFTSHAILTALFMILPILLTHHMHWNNRQQTEVYVGVMVAAFFIMLPLVMWSEKKYTLKPTLLVSMTCVAIAPCLLYYTQHQPHLFVFILLIFFVSFTLLETLLPSLISKAAPIRQKGAAMGLYSTAQFAGIFIGGSIGGLLYEHWQFMGILTFCGALGILWILLTSPIPAPPCFSTVILDDLKTTQDNKGLLHSLTTMTGIHEVVLCPVSHLLHVKIDKRIISKTQLRNVIKASTLTNLSADQI